MKSSIFLYAFTDPDREALSRFSSLVKKQLKGNASYLIGVSWNDSSAEIENARVFPKGVSCSQMINQMAADTDHDVLVLNDGVALPIIDPPIWSKIDNLAQGSLLTFDGRVPVSSVDPLALEANEMSWSNIEFNRSQHEESPLSYIVTRRDFLHIRGYDERKSYDDCRTLDVLARLRRSSVTMKRLSDTKTFALDLRYSYVGIVDPKDIYPVSRREKQKDHVQSDLSIYRNLEIWSVRSDRRPVLVSVAIATQDRSEYLKDSINSVLAQAFEDFEIIVVDDGSVDDTEAVVRGFSDPRVRYLYQAASGISAARNYAADESQGHFTAVHDDDDLMLPWRLATSLKTLTSGIHATYGSWVNFDNLTAEMALHITKRDFGRDLVAFSGQTPGHATWLLPTSIVRTVRYDESLSSSVDHNLAVRTVMSGLRWQHSEQVLFLRRMHPNQVSQTDAKRQKAAAVLTRYANGFSADFSATKTMIDNGKSLTFPAPADKAKLFRTFAAYLPDHLVRRQMFIQGLVGKKVLALDLHDRFEFIAAETDLLSDRSTLELGGAQDIEWSDIVSLRKSGIVGCRFHATHRGNDDQINEEDSNSSVETLVQDRQAREFLSLLKSSPSAVLLRVEIDSVSKESILSVDGLISAKHFSINYGGYERKRFIILGFKTIDYLYRYLDDDSVVHDSFQIIVSAQRDFTIAADAHLGMM